jgi:hypothetical protein
MPLNKIGWSLGGVKMPSELQPILLKRISCADLFSRVYGLVFKFCWQSWQTP